jgi:O-antigen/teichoic acid export membrane protein
MSNTKTIARNTGWYGIEIATSFVLQLFTSIAIARTLGPSKMGYIIYVSWIAGVISNLGGLGIPATTGKYMAEFLGMGDRGTARFIYFRTLYLQIGLATLATGGLAIWVLNNAAAEYRVAALLVVLSIWPGMVNFISGAANVATEELSKNLPGSIAAMFMFFTGIAATVVFHWGVIGVGGATLAMRSTDLLVRFFPTVRRVLAWENTHAHPAGLRKRMMTFAWQSVASMLAAMVVWDRSEFILLKKLCADIREVAYYSVAFSMAERLLFSATVFAWSSGATIFAQYGRDKSKLPDLTASSFRYLALTSIPLHVIATALAAPALLILYGHQYTGAIAVVTLAPLLCMPKAFMGPVQRLLQSTEKQHYIIGATVIAGIVDMGVAWWLIPSYGAVGACIGSGAGQVTAIGLMWIAGIRLFKVKLPWVQVAKISFCSAAAALAAHVVVLRLAPVWGVLLGGLSSLIVLFLLIYVLQVLEPKDRERFMVLTGMMPKRISRPLDRVLSLLVRPQLAAVTQTNL